VSAAAIAALVVTGVLVAALAFYLIWVVLILRRLTDTLGKVVFGVGAIAHRAQPVEQILGEINTDLAGVADALEALAADLDPQRAARAS
jgi:xanthine dehydrogenase iron-sulfur cluster and FAD-binding subunit A